ncbi:small EDRK-rich factor 2-like [Echinops telfairi]|uniref:Small EDRK-rich factor 2-like n=1 Tax=Echinops telfairi TaxID=9371 RepID=A0AC55CSL6_ECHTE|nr:small EDRK-rich factor 2-like [Echinops telfairi]
MKKQSNSLKGKRRDDGLSAAAHKQRDLETTQQKQKKANTKEDQVALWLSVQPSCPPPPVCLEPVLPGSAFLL